jgi:hypothetical protein
MDILDILENRIYLPAKYPTTVTDGCICDFYGRKKGAYLTRSGLASANVPDDVFRNLKIMASSCRRLNKVYGQYQTWRYACVLLYHPKTNTSTKIQESYYIYFTTKYQGAKFFTNARPDNVVAVRTGNKLVGVLMPVNTR